MRRRLPSHPPMEALFTFSFSASVFLSCIYAGKPKLRLILSRAVLERDDDGDSARPSFSSLCRTVGGTQSNEGSSFEARKLWVLPMEMRCCSPEFRFLISSPTMGQKQCPLLHVVGLAANCSIGGGGAYRYHSHRFGAISLHNQPSSTKLFI